MNKFWKAEKMENKKIMTLGKNMSLKIFAIVMSALMVFSGSAWAVHPPIVSAASQYGVTVNEPGVVMDKIEFDTDEPSNPYPSIAGTFTGTITPNRTIIATKLYTHALPGTGGHTKHALIYNETWAAEASWDGFVGNWRNITFNRTVVLIPYETYNITLITGSYPQIHHVQALETENGWINSTSFVDVNGRIHEGWIPAIRLHTAPIQIQPVDSWYLTLIEQIDVSGANTYRMATAQVVNVIREQGPDGSKYIYSPRDIAGMVAGQEDPGLFTFTPMTFEIDPETGKVTSDETLLIGLFDFVNLHLGETVKERQPGDTWQAVIPISQDTRYLPTNITVTFEMKSIFLPHGRELLYVHYYSEPFSFYAFDEEGGYVEASFTGFITNDPNKKVAIHNSWHFVATRTMADGRNDTFNHLIVSYKSDPYGLPMVPLDIYEWATPLEDVEMVKIVSDYNPPQWAAQALGLSRIAWTVTEINTGQITNPFPFAAIAAVIAVVVIADVIIDLYTDVFNEGPAGDGFSMFKQGGRFIAECLGLCGDTGHLVGGGVRLGLGLVTKAGPMKMAEKAGIISTPLKAEKAVEVGKIAETVKTAVDIVNFVTDTVRITIEEQKAAVVHQPPIAHAGADQIVHTGTLVTLDGLASYDPEGMSLSFKWNQIAGPSVTLSDPSIPKPEFTPTVEGHYTFTLEVFDGKWAGVDFVVITVKPVIVEPEPAVIVLENADNVWQLGMATPDSRLLDAARTVAPRIFIERAGAVYHRDLETAPEELLQIAGTVAPRIFIERAGAVYHRDLETAPEELLQIAGTVAPRIFIERAGAVYHMDLETAPEELLQIAGTVAPRIFIERAGAVYHRDLETAPEELLQIAGTVAPRIFIERAGATYHRGMRKPPIA